MALIPYSDLFPQVLMSVEGCPPTVAIDAIRNGVIDFCRESWAYTFEHDPISSVADQSKYAFAPPADTVVVRVLQAWYDGVPLDEATPDGLHRRFQNWRTESGSVPDSYLQEDEDNVILVPIPTTAIVDALVMMVSLAPSRASTTFESRFREHHLDALVLAAHARLFAMREKPWTNLKLAEIKRLEFEDMAASHRRRVQKGFVRSRIRAKAYFL